MGDVSLGEVVAAEIGNGEFAEDVVEDGGGARDAVIAGDLSGRLEAREHKGVDEFFQWHAVLQSDRCGDGEIVHQAAKRGAFLVHVEEDLAELAVVEFACVQVDLVAADSGFLDIALAAVRQARAGGAARLCELGRGLWCVGLLGQFLGEGEDMLHPVAHIVARRGAVAHEVRREAVCGDGFGHVETSAGADRDRHTAAEHLVTGGGKADLVLGGDIQHEAAFLQGARSEGFTSAINGGFGLGDVRARETHGREDAASVGVKVFRREFQIMRDDLVAEDPAGEGSVERQAFA